jgi:hypothetical protein
MNIYKNIVFFLIVPLLIQCSVGVYFNTVIDGIVYEGDAQLVINNVNYNLSKMSVTNYHHSPQLEIEITNNSADTLFYNPHKIEFYKNQEYFLNECGKDSTYILPPNEECEICFYVDDWIFEMIDPTPFREGKRKPIEIKIGLLMQGFILADEMVKFPLIRYTRENENEFLQYRFITD